MNRKTRITTLLDWLEGKTDNSGGICSSLNLHRRKFGREWRVVLQVEVLEHPLEKEGRLR